MMNKFNRSTAFRINMEVRDLWQSFIWELEMNAPEYHIVYIHYGMKELSEFK